MSDLNKAVILTDEHETNELSSSLVINVSYD